MEKNTEVTRDVNQNVSQTENGELFSETSRVSFASTGIDWTADGTDNAGWNVKSYAEL